MYWLTIWAFAQFVLTAITVYTLSALLDWPRKKYVPRRTEEGQGKRVNVMVKNRSFWKIIGYYIKAKGISG